MTRSARCTTMRSMKHPICWNVLPTSGQPRCSTTHRKRPVQLHYIFRRAVRKRVGLENESLATVLRQLDNVKTNRRRELLQLSSRCEAVCEKVSGLLEAAPPEIWLGHSVDVHLSDRILPLLLIPG